MHQKRLICNLISNQSYHINLSHWERFFVIQSDRSYLYNTCEYLIALIGYYERIFSLSTEVAVFGIEISAVSLLGDIVVRPDWGDRLKRYCHTRLESQMRSFFVRIIGDMRIFVETRTHTMTRECFYNSKASRFDSMIDYLTKMRHLRTSSYDF